MTVRTAIKRSINQLKGAPQAHELIDDTAKPYQGDVGDHWGYHLILNISGCNKKIDDENAVEQFLSELVEALDMKTLYEPVVIRVDSKSEGRGVTGFTLIETSHISIHGDDESWSAYIDVFSCKPYEPETAIKLIQDCFEPKKIATFWLFRDAGDYPKK